MKCKVCGEPVSKERRKENHKIVTCSVVCSVRNTRELRRKANRECAQRRRARLKAEAARENHA